MDRDLPVVNRRIIQRERQNCYEGHRNRLQKIRPVIDNLLPKSAEVKFNKGKKEEMKIERKKVIDIENKILVSKILSIQKNPTKFHRRAADVIKRETATNLRSLNVEVRKNQMMQITMENFKMLNRLHHQKTSISFDQLKSEEKQRQKILGNLCIYPLSLYYGSNQNEHSKSFRSKSTSRKSRKSKKLPSMNQDQGPTQKPFRIKTKKASKRSKSSQIENQRSLEFKEPLETGEKSIIVEENKKKTKSVYLRSFTFHSSDEVLNVEAMLLLKDGTEKEEVEINFTSMNYGSILRTKITLEKWNEVSEKLGTEEAWINYVCELYEKEKIKNEEKEGQVEREGQVEGHLES